MTLTQPLRDEHAELAPHIDALRTAGHAVGDGDLAKLRALVDASYEFLVHQLIPRAQAEELALYPAVQRADGAVEATATMALTTSRFTRSPTSSAATVSSSRPSRWSMMTSPTACGACCTGCITW